MTLRIEDEAEALVASAAIFRHIHAIRSGDLPAPLDLDELQSMPEASTEVARTRVAPLPGPPKRSEPLDLGALVSNPPPPRRWLWDGWVSRGTVTGLYGSPGIGKSNVALQLALAIARGMPMFDAPTARGSALLYMCEDDADECGRRLLGIARSEGFNLEDMIDLVRVHPRVGFENSLAHFDDGCLRLLDFAAQVYDDLDKSRPDLLVLDPLSQIFTGNENDRAAVTAFVNYLGGIAQTYDCAVLVLGHPAKADGSTYSGSTAWDGAFRSRLWLDREGDLLRLKRPKANYAARIDDGLRLRWDDGRLVLVSQGEVQRAEEDAKADRAAHVDRIVLDGIRHLITVRKQFPTLAQAGERSLGGLLAAVNMAGDATAGEIRASGLRLKATGSLMKVRVGKDRNRNSVECMWPSDLPVPAEFTVVPGPSEHGA